MTRVYLPPVDGGHRVGCASQELVPEGQGTRGGGTLPWSALPQVVRLNGARIQDARIALGGVAPVPYRSRQVEDYLTGMDASEIDPVLAGSMAVPGARPMADNRYKVSLASNMVKRAILQLLAP